MFAGGTTVVEPVSQSIQYIGHDMFAGGTAVVEPVPQRIQCGG